MFFKIINIEETFLKHYFDLYLNSIDLIIDFIKEEYIEEDEDEILEISVSELNKINTLIDDMYCQIDKLQDEIDNDLLELGKVKNQAIAPKILEEKIKFKENFISELYKILEGHHYASI